MYELLHELQNESELEIDRKSPVSYKKKTKFDSCA